MRYYWEALFSVEYFPYWEFSMLMMLCLVLSLLIRIYELIREQKELKKEILELKEMVLMSHTIISNSIKEDK
tara:strand:- start:2002 stop:2217 length:216 start_codon:yes stop_codon:yes gene_type:complete